MGWALVEHNIVFYAYDGNILVSNPIWVQTTLMVVVRMFGRVGLQTNLVNTKIMVYNTVFIWGKLGV